MCILRHLWRTIWRARRNQRQHSPERGRISKRPSPRHVTLPASTPQVLERIFKRYGEQCNEKRKARFELEHDLKWKNDRATLRIREDEIEANRCTNDKPLQEKVLDETKSVLIERRNAERRLKKARKKIDETAVKQRDDERSYNRKVQRHLSDNDGRDDPEIPIPSAAAIEGLRTACEAERARKRAEENLENLRSKLRRTRSEARAKLQQAGLLHYEAQVQRLMHKITTEETRLSKSQSTHRAGLGAFYTARGRNLQREGSQPKEERAKIVPTVEEQEQWQLEGADWGLAIKLKKAEVENHRKSYDIPLQEYVDAKNTWISRLLGTTKDQLERDFTRSWIRELKRLLKSVQKIENENLVQIKEAMSKGIAIPVDYEAVEDDLPECLGSQPNDGMTASLGTDSREALENRAERHEPRTEEWKKLTRQEAPAFIQAAIATALGKPFDGDSITSSEIKRECAYAALDEVPDEKVIVALNEPPDTDSMTPWDSVTFVDKRPRRKALLDQYRRACMDLDYT